MKAPLWIAIVVGIMAVGCEMSQAAHSVSAPAPSPSAAASPSASPIVPSSTPTVQPQAHSAHPSTAPAASSTPEAQTPPHRSTANAEGFAVQYLTYHSRVLGIDRTYGLALPPGYNQHPQEHYPVIVLLHGGSGDQTDWFNLNKGDAAATLHQLYSEGKLPPSIVVTPDGNDLRGKSRYHDPQYFDGPNGKIATALGDELVQVIQSRYRTLNQPDFWAIGGLSSGAWGAVNIGLHFANHYHILFSHSGYFVDRSGAANSPQSYIKTLPGQTLGQLHIYLDAGESDPNFLRPSQAFYAELQQLNIHSHFAVFPGTHSWQYWRTHLADSLSYVGQQFQRSLTQPHVS